MGGNKDNIIKKTAQLCLKEMNEYVMGWGENGGASVLCSAGMRS